MKKLLFKLLIFIVSICLVGILSPIRANAYFDDDFANGMNSENVFVMEYQTNQILFEKDGYERLAPASMTKMLTGIVVIENTKDLQDTVTIDAEIMAELYAANASVAGLQIGDEVTIEDLLYCLALPSGGDAAHALAHYISKDIPTFAQKMNETAKKIGMDDSHFSNPTGLDDEDQYSTCADIAKLLQYCIQNETFRTIFSKQKHTTKPLNSHPDGLTVYSTFLNVLQDAVPEAIGGKTGYTDDAGHCLATWGKVNDMDVIVVTAHAMTSMYDTSQINDNITSYRNLYNWHYQTLLEEGQILQQIEVPSRKKVDTVDVSASSSFALCLPDTVSPNVEANFPNEVDALLNDQTITGPITVSVEDEILFEEEVEVTIPKEKDFIGRLQLRFNEMTKGCR